MVVNIVCVPVGFKGFSIGVNVWLWLKGYCGFL
jgi:hypothetical protein